MSYRYLSKVLPPSCKKSIDKRVRVIQYQNLLASNFQPIDSYSKKQQRYLQKDSSPSKEKSGVLMCLSKGRYFLISMYFQTELFTKILSCVYGHSTTIRRYDINDAYQISRGLQIPTLLQQFQNDMMTHFDQYDIFPLLKLATKEQLSELVDLCYDQLQIQMYEPMRYNKSGLFLCDIELFKSIIKRHNFKKSNNDKFGLTYAEINQIIDEYCFVNGFNKEQKEKLIGEIEDKQNMRYYISLNQVLRKPLTPSRTKSTSEIFQRTTLTLPREKDQQKNSFLIVKNRRLSPCVNSFSKSNEASDHDHDQDHDDFDNLNLALVSSPIFCKSQTSDKSKSNSNISTDNKSLKNRSRRQSTGSVETISDPKILVTIVQIAQNQKALRQSQTQMKSRAEQMLKKMKSNLQINKQKSSKIQRMESSLQELKAEISCSKEKLKELEKTVDNVEIVNHQHEIRQKFDKLFETNIALDLTESTEIEMREPMKACRI